MKKRSTKRSMFEKLVLAVSALLVMISGVMYAGIDKNKVELQSPRGDFFAKVESDQPAEEKKSNPFVIRNGSNAMPEGMGQGEGEEFMPKWQKDRLKDSKDRGIETAAPAPSGGITPPTHQVQPQSGGITPPTHQVQPQSGDVAPPTHPVQTEPPIEPVGDALDSLSGDAEMP